MRGRKHDAMPDWLRHVPGDYQALVMHQVNAHKRARGSCEPTGAGMMAPISMPASMPLPSAHLLHNLRKETPSQLASGIGELAGPKGTEPVAAVMAKPVGVEEVSEPPRPAAHVPETAVVVGDARRPDMSVADLEASLLAGYSQKTIGILKLWNDMKEGTCGEKGEGADKTKAGAKVLKRPAGRAAEGPDAATSMLPDASSIDMSGMFAKLRARKATMDLKRFTSMAYHSADKLAKNAGFSDDKAKAIARDASAKASALFKER